MSKNSNWEIEKKKKKKCGQTRNIMNFQRCIFVRFPEKDTHQWHLPNEVGNF